MEQQQQQNVSTTLPMNATMKKLIDEMEKGKESTQILRNILLQMPRLNVVNDDEHHVYFKTLDHHCMVALTSCVTSLSLMRSCNFDGKVVGKRKMDHMMDVNDAQLKHEDHNSKDKRGCYKRRKIGEARIEEMSHLRDDGFGWRKYGQKVILNAKHPRNYYRCTHKFDKNCQASKQVQQISENPTKYKIIYHGNHICNHNILNNQTPIIIDDDCHQEQHSSGIVLSFNQTNQVNPLLFPISTSSASTAVMKQEYNSPLSDQSTSHDRMTAVTGLSSSTTLVSEQSDLVSTAENCYSNVTQGEFDENYSSIWNELDYLPIDNAFGNYNLA